MSITSTKKKQDASIKVHMPSELRDEFSRVTDRLGQTQSAVVRHMIESYLQQHSETEITFQDVQQVNK